MGTKGRGKDGRFLKGFPHPKERIQLDIKLIKKKYLKDELSTYDIATELNTTQKTIYNRLRENNIKIRKNGHSQRTKQKIKETMNKKQNLNKATCEVCSKELTLQEGHICDKCLRGKDEF